MRARGVQFRNPKSAELALSNSNYYRISGYWYQFLNKANGSCICEIQFDDIMQLYNFDEELRSLLFNAIRLIEIKVRTSMAYVLSHAYGPYALYERCNFVAVNHYDNFIQTLDEAKSDNANFLPVVHYNENYGGILPPWVALELVSFSTLAKLYNNLREADKDKIALCFNMRATGVLNNWIHSMAMLRNRCAHHARIYNAALEPQAKFTSPRYKSNPMDTSKLFSRICMICALLPTDAQRVEFIDAFIQLIHKYTTTATFEPERIGLTDMWEKWLITWKRDRPNY